MADNKFENCSFDDNAGTLYARGRYRPNGEEVVNSMMTDKKIEGFDTRSGEGFDPSSGKGLDTRSGEGFDTRSGEGFDPSSGKGLDTSKSSTSTAQNPLSDFVTGISDGTYSPYFEILIGLAVSSIVVGIIIGSGSHLPAFAIGLIAAGAGLTAAGVACYNAAGVACYNNGFFSGGSGSAGMVAVNRAPDSAVIRADGADEAGAPVLYANV